MKTRNDLLSSTVATAKVARPVSAGFSIPPTEHSMVLTKNERVYLRSRDADHQRMQKMLRNGEL